MTTASGVAGGAVAWLLGNIEALTKIVSFLGAFCGAMVALISLILKIAEWRRRRRLLRGRIVIPPYVDDLP